MKTKYYWTSYASLFLAAVVTAASDASDLCKDKEPSVVCDSKLLCDCADRVHDLPGYDGSLPSAWYSGYLSYDMPEQNVTIHTHYVYIEAQDDDEETKPLIYWSNGGPGASSLFGLLTELGPLLLNDNSLVDLDGDVPKPLYNPYSWNLLGSLLIFDQPAPVGFSFCDDLIDEKYCSKNWGWTDELASASSLKALEAFYEKFPAVLERDLYLTGESYAGIYIPTLARRVLTEAPDLPLVGFAVGDGCLGTETGLCGIIGSDEAVDLWQVLFLAGHHQMPLSTYMKVLKACHKHDDNDDDVWLTEDDKCREAVKFANDQVGAYYEYALYDECFYNSDFKLGGALNDYPCGGEAVMSQWLKTSAVQKALHVKGTFFEVDNADGFDYTATEKDLTGFYKDTAAGTRDIKMLVYNGDTDPSITSFAAQNWTSHLGLEVTESWRPWTSDGCKAVGGYVTRYKGGLDFLTLRGAGHLVPAYKPVASFSFLKAWLEGEPYPYWANCTPFEVVES